MFAKVLVTAGALAYGVLVPVLEINGTHVFNPDWPAHARLHEVWQLATNTCLAAICLWLAWFREDVRLPSLLALLVTGGFMFAYLVRSSYGGSMVHPDGTEKLLLGVNAGVVVFGLVILLSLAALLLDGRAKAAA